MTVSKWFAGLVVMAALTTGVGSAVAATLPMGSYRDSCNGARASGGVLRAHCERQHGRRVWARLERYASCVGDISNFDGQLICLRRRDVPGGSWSETCKDAHLVEPGVFGAECRSLRGGHMASQIALDKCREGVMNASGHLACDKARPPEPVREPTPPQNPTPPSDDEPPAPGGQPLPAGSYQGSCRNLDFDGQFLSGACRDKHGAWQDTSLDTLSCRPDQEVGSEGGVLICTRSEQGREPPDGSYTKTCREVTFDGRFLRGECRDKQSAWERATLDMRNCHAQNDIANDDGEIVCRHNAVNAPAGGEVHGTNIGGLSGGPATGGGTGASITLYEKAGFEGSSKTFNGDAPNLTPLGWNDHASSLQVRGTWEVCEDANFAGRCQRTSEDEPNLADIGMNDRISSLRQVR